MWKKEWAKGRIPGEGKKKLWLIWCFALAWNAISAPLLWQFSDIVHKEGPYAAALAALFPLIGAVMLVAAIRASLRWRKFGAAAFEMKTLPGVIGGKLAGVIHTDVRIAPEAGVALRLLCINRVTSGSGKNRSTFEHIRWESEERIEAGQLQLGPRGSAIPIDFTIPYDCEPSDDQDPSNEILWRLEISAALPGFDFAKQFVVPVFRTGDSSPEVTLDDETVRELEQSTAPLEVLPHSKVRIERHPSGTLSLWFGPARNLGAAFGITTFTIIWSGATVGISLSSAPMLFPIVFGFFSILMVLASIGMWLGTSRIAVSAGELRVKRGLLGLGLEKSYRRDDIAKVEEKIGFQAGTKVYYSLQLRLKSGRTSGIAGGISDKREALALVRTLSQALA
jgi:hypothetical protein